MPKPVCVPCKLFYRPEENGFHLTEGAPTGSKWRPYKLWMADKWKCRGCGHEIIVGFGLSPVAIEHEPGFERIRTKGGFDQLQINDC